VRTRPRAAAGFTLVEMLVVIAIIGVLAGLILVGVRAARRSAARSACEARIQALKSALQTYANDFGDYPPTSLAGLSRSPGKNEGIESLIHCLTTRQGESSPYFEPEKDELGNTDGDAQARNVADSRLGGAECLELLDPWGNPFVYYHHRDLKPVAGPAWARLQVYVKGDGQSAKTQPRPDDRTKSYPGETSYQLWSFGPNGENEDGAGDDVRSW